MHSPLDPPSDAPNDPFIIESSSQLSYHHRFEPVIHSTHEDDDDYLKPFIIVFRLDPFTTHDGVHGRPVPASARAHIHPEGTQSVTFEFQLDLGSSPASESESNSEGDPTSRSPPDPDIAITPGQLRYLDGEIVPSGLFSEPPRTQFATWSSAPLFHPLPQPSRQSFPQLDSTTRPPTTFHAHSHFDDQNHPFTRADRTPEPEATPVQQQPSNSMYPHSLAQRAHHAGSGSESMYASESTLEVGQESPNGYQYAHSSSNTSGSDGYPPTLAPPESDSYSQGDTYHHRAYSQPQQSFPSHFARNDVPSQHALFATPAQMSISSCREGIYPATSGDPGASPTPYSGSHIDPTNRHLLGHAGSSSLELHHPADGHYGSDSTLRGDDCRGASHVQSDLGVRDATFSSPQPDLTRRPPYLASYDSHPRGVYFQSAPRGYSQITSRGYEQGAGGFEQPASEPYNSRSPSSGVLDRRGSLTYDRPISRTSSGAFSRPPSDAFNDRDTLDLVESSSPYPLVSRTLDCADSDQLHRPASRTFSSFTGHTSLDSLHASGTITPMRVFDSPAGSPTLSPAPSTASSLVDQRGTSQAARQFAPFAPGGMSRGGGGGKHRCTVCNKLCKRPSTLAAHMNSHTGEQPHLCPVKSCGRRFSVQSNLRRHAKTHKLPGPTPRAPRKKTTTTARKDESAPLRPRALQERKNVQSWCPESLQGMRNAKSLSSRPPFIMPNGAAPLPAPLPAVRPRGHPGDENYEERDSFFYAQEMDQPTPYHPIVWKLRPTLPGPMPSQADREARARGAYGFGGTLSGFGTG